GGGAGGAGAGGGGQFRGGGGGGGPPRVAAAGVGRRAGAGPVGGGPPPPPPQSRRCAPRHESPRRAVVDPASQRRDRFGRGGGRSKARHPPLQQAAGHLVSPSAAGLDLGHARYGAGRNPPRARALTRGLLPQETDGGAREAGGKNPPRRSHFHIDVEMSKQDAPRVDAAGEEIDHRFADRGHRGRAAGKKQEVKRGYLAVASVKGAVRQQPDQEARHQHRLVDVELGLDEEMHGRDHRDAIDQAVDAVPAPRTEPAYGGVR